MTSHQFFSHRVRVMVFNATFNNISVKSWRSVLTTFHLYNVKNNLLLLFDEMLIRSVLC